MDKESREMESENPAITLVPNSNGRSGRVASRILAYIFQLSAHSLHNSPI